MSRRVPELSASNRAAGSASVTPGVIDEAAHRVLRDQDGPTREAMTSLWAGDSNLPVTHMVHEAMAARAARSSFLSVGREKFVVVPSLEDEEQKQLIEAWPDMDFEFRPRAGHDHGLAAVTRVLDDMKDRQQLPPRLTYLDIGADLVSNVAAGRAHAVSMVPIADAKDAQRRVLSDLRLRELAVSAESVVVRDLATRALAGDPSVVVRCTLQEFNRPVRVAKLTHVYDIPLAHIFDFMVRCDTELVTGSIHFTDEVFECDRGVMPSVGARYEVDRAKDEFRMGFVGSSARWYPHVFSEYLRYSTNQVVSVGGRRFAYNIIERRGQTIRFRILRVAGGASEAYVSRHEHYVLPRVEAVVVDGFTLRGDSVSVGSRRKLERRRYVYPKGTWERMVRVATTRMARGQFDCNQMIGEYKTIVAGLKYNGVKVSEAAVPVEELPMLAVMACLHAVADNILTRRTLHAFAALTMEERSLSLNNAFVLSLRTFFSGAVALLAAPFSWLTSLLQGIEKLSAQALYSHIVEVHDMARVRRVPAEALLQRGKFWDMESDQDETYAEFDLRDHMIENDGFLEFAREMERQAERRDASAAAAKVEVTVDGSTVVEPTGCPDWMPLKHDYDGLHLPNAEQYEFDPGYHTVAMRSAAMMDAANACAHEMNHLEAWMADIYARAVSQSFVSVQRLKENDERWKGADVWDVENGVIKGPSAKGAKLDAFQYSGVYCPVPMDFNVDDAGGEPQVSRLRPVEERVARWVDGGKTVEYLQSVVTGGDSYTGKVMTCASLLVFNGRPIERALKSAAQSSWDYEAGVYNGGPGAGKTVRIVERADLRYDMVMSPLKLSTLDVREAFEEKGVAKSLVHKRAVTVDSVLTRAGLIGAEELRRRVGTVDTLYVDECYNVLAGRSYGAIDILRPVRVVMYGDKLQIPPVVRATYTPLFNHVRVPHVVMSWIVYRGTPEVLAIYNRHYGNRLRTVNKNRGSVKIIKSMDGFSPGKGELLHMVMYQAAKPEVRGMLRNVPGTVSSTHEAQGKSAEITILHSLDVRKRGDAMNLFQNPFYVGVAASRTRNVAILHVKGDEETCALKWYREATDPRRIKACADLASVGQDVEFM